MNGTPRTDALCRAQKSGWDDLVDASQDYVRLLDFARELERELNARGEALHSIPEGWALVPVEPTFEMWDQAENASVDFETWDDATMRKNGAFNWPTFRIAKIIHVWRAMLAAAPSFIDTE